MKHIKLFENYNGVKLHLKFDDVDEYLKAVDYFNSKSNFYFDDINYEFKTITFHCSDQDDADITEEEIDAELLKNNFDNYYFESE